MTAREEKRPRGVATIRAKKKAVKDAKKNQSHCRRRPLRRGETSSLCGRFGENCVVSLPPHLRRARGGSSLPALDNETWLLYNGKLKLPFIAMRMRFERPTMTRDNVLYSLVPLIRHSCAYNVLRNNNILYALLSSILGRSFYLFFPLTARPPRPTFNVPFSRPRPCAKFKSV